jgi:hypothetical protein
MLGYLKNKEYETFEANYEDFLTQIVETLKAILAKSDTL